MRTSMGFLCAGKSNSGEGGEDPVRWDVVRDADEAGVSATFPYLRGLRNGDIATSRIKQARPRLRAVQGGAIPCMYGGQML